MCPRRNKTVISSINMISLIVLTNAKRVGKQIFFTAVKVFLRPVCFAKGIDRASLVKMLHCLCGTRAVAILRMTEELARQENRYRILLERTNVKIMF